MIQKLSYLVLITLLLFIVDSCKKNSIDQDESSVVIFIDANIEELIREVLNKPTSDITLNDLKTVTNLAGVRYKNA